MKTDIGIPRRRVLAGALALVVAGALPARAQFSLPPVTVYKNPSCGCCGEWVKHLRANGFRAEVHDIDDVEPIKRKLGVPRELASCHTAVVGGYAVEGHVPAGDIKRLLREKPTALGLAVPGMPIGSPGMEQGPPQPYSTILFGERGKTSVYARH